MTHVLYLSQGVIHHQNKYLLCLRGVIGLRVPTTWWISSSH